MPTCRPPRKRRVSHRGQSCRRVDASVRTRLPPPPLRAYTPVKTAASSPGGPQRVGCAHCDACPSALRSSPPSVSQSISRPDPSRKHAARRDGKQRAQCLSPSMVYWTRSPSTDPLVTAPSSVDRQTPPVEASTTMRAQIFAVRRRDSWYGAEVKGLVVFVAAAPPIAGRGLRRRPTRLEAPPPAG
jgi:hypothetical protein